MIRFLSSMPMNGVVSSVHRPHLLTRFIEVIFMVHGRIVDMGTAAELTDRQPAFRVSLEKASARTQPQAPSP
jgi:ATP-binding cassette, subfamily B, bacterial